MDLEAIRLRLRHLEPLVFGGPDGSIRVLAKSARVMCDVPVGGLTDEKAIATEIEGVLSEPVGSRQEPPIWLRVNVVSEAFGLDDVWHALGVLAEFLKPHAGVQLVLHFANPPEEWGSILSNVKLLRETLRQPNDLTIQATGPFSAITDSEMESLFGFGVYVIFQAGCSWHYKSDRCFDVDMSALRRFSTFGFRTPVTLHVHENNIGEIESSLPNVLRSNCYSGFSLPLVSCSPYYRFSDGCPSLPDAKEYCHSGCAVTNSIRITMMYCHR